jgi:hypothetical protein
MVTSTDSSGSASRAGMRMGLGMTFAWPRKNDNAEMNRAKHMRHRCRASRAAPWSVPDRITHIPRAWQQSDDIKQEEWKGRNPVSLAASKAAGTFTAGALFRPTAITSPRGTW